MPSREDEFFIEESQGRTEESREDEFFIEESQGRTEESREDGRVKGGRIFYRRESREDGRVKGGRKSQGRTEEFFPRTRFRALKNMIRVGREGCIVDKSLITESHIQELTVVQDEYNSMYKNINCNNNCQKTFEVYRMREDGYVLVPRKWAETNICLSSLDTRGLHGAIVLQDNCPVKTVVQQLPGSQLLKIAQERPVKIGSPCAGPRTSSWAIVDFGSICTSERLLFQGRLLNDTQEAAAEACVTNLRESGCGVLSMATGMGKTVVALYACCELRVKTLVVVHRQCLMSQWAERVQQFVPEARVGKIQQGTIDVEDCDIVVGMLQSISMRNYDIDIFSDIGMIIFDEVHAIPTSVFSRVFIKLCVPYMLGLSATPERKDGLSRVIHWFIGPTIFEKCLEERNEIVVRVVNYTFTGLSLRQLLSQLPNVKTGSREDVHLPKILNMAAVINKLCNMASRNELIVKTIKNLVYEGHRVIVLSDRRLHCEELVSMLMPCISSALYIGGMKEHELEKSKESTVLIATYAIAKEGLDIPQFDALVLATPRSDVIQACGRVLHSNTHNSPVIVDVVDNWNLGMSQFRKRHVYYTKSGFTIC